MIRQKLAVCAESVVRDAETNVVSIFNIHEELNSEGFPVVIPRLATLFFLERAQDDPAQIDSTVRITLDGEELAQLSVRVDFQHALINRHIVLMQGLQIPRPGVLRVSLALGQNELPGWSMTVRHRVTAGTGADYLKHMQ